MGMIEKCSSCQYISRYYGVPTLCVYHYEEQALFLGKKHHDPANEPEEEEKPEPAFKWLDTCPKCDCFATIASFDGKLDRKCMRCEEEWMAETVPEWEQRTKVNIQDEWRGSCPWCGFQTRIISYTGKDRNCQTCRRSWQQNEYREIVEHQKNNRRSRSVDKHERSSTVGGKQTSTGVCDESESCSGLMGPYGPADPRT